MRTDVEDARDHEGRQLRVHRLDRVHRRAQHREAIGHVGRIELPPQKGLEPAERDVHVSPGRPTASRNRMSPPSSRRMSGTP